jgi:L-threonylcarbamoyladenylate synthase
MRSEIGNDILKSVEILNHGGLVAIPTETVYGLAANGLDAVAVAKIFEAKNRPFFDPLILHIAQPDALNQIVTNVPQKAKILMDHFWPGPLTFILPKSNLVPDLVTSGNSTVAVRIPNHPMTLQLLSELSFPLAAPSANPFGYVSPTNAQHVHDQLGHKIDYILDGGSCCVGIESTIISFENEPTILRLGGITQKEIEHIIGAVSISLNEHSNPRAPGQLDQHYSPHCTLKVLNYKELQTNSTILFYSPESEIKYWKLNPKINCNTVYLTPKNDSIEAAANLFAILRDFDKKGLSEIFIELAENEGLGLAINDRLNRAMAKRD